MIVRGKLPTQPLFSRRGFLHASAAAASLLPAQAADPPARSADGDLNATYVRNSVRLACGWLIDTAQIKSDRLNGESNTRQFPYKHWKGALRGDYRAADHKWDFSAPMW